MYCVLQILLIYLSMFLFKLDHKLWHILPGMHDLTFLMRYNKMNDIILNSEIFYDDYLNIERIIVLTEFVDENIAKIIVLFMSQTCLMRSKIK